MTPFADIVFINEEATGCINEEAIGAINKTATSAILVPRNLSCFFILGFTVSVTSSINRPDFSRHSTILIISLIS